jgi:hypothetical protein
MHWLFKKSSIGLEIRPQVPLLTCVPHCLLQTLLLADLIGQPTADYKGPLAERILLIWTCRESPSRFLQPALFCKVLGAFLFNLNLQQCGPRFVMAAANKNRWIFPAARAPMAADDFPCFRSAHPREIMSRRLFLIEIIGLKSLILSRFQDVQVFHVF